MKRKFLLLVMMCLFGGLSSLLAQDVTVHIGSDGTSKLEKAPFNLYAINSVCQQIYTVDEFKKYATNGTIPDGKISKLTFFENGGQNLKCTKVKIYMKEITTSEKDSFSSSSDWYKNWDSVDLVFDSGDTKELEIKGGVLEITLDTPFVWNDKTKNILVYVDVNAKSSASAKSYFKAFPSLNSKKQTLYYSGNSTAGLDVNNWRNGSSPTNTKAQMAFTFSSGSSDESTAPTDPTAPALNLPGNGAANQIKPLIRFTIKENTTHYQIWMGTSENDMTEETEWIETNKDEEIDFHPSNLTYNPATKYYWKVIAKNVKDDKESNIVESSVYSFTTKAITAAPAKATYKTSNGITCTESYPNLEWEYDGTTFEYKVFVGTNEELKDDKDADGDYVKNNDIVQDWTDADLANGNSFQTSGLAVGTYYWRVDVRNDVDITTGDVYSFTIPGVENISNAEADPNGKKLSWTFAEGTSQYRVLLGTTDKENPEHPYTFLEYKTDWTDVTGEEGEYELPASLKAGTIYYWAVEVKNYVEQKIYFNEIEPSKPIYGEENAYGIKPIIGYTPAKYEHQVEVYSFVTSALAAAQNSSPKNKTIKEDNPTLTWKFNGDATYYKVFLGTNQDSLKAKTDWLQRETGEVDGIVSPKSTGSYQTSELELATKYYWRIDVKNDKGEEVQGTDIWWFGTTLPITTVEAVPSNIFPTLGVYGGTNINWDLVGAQSYNVYLDNLSDEKDAEIIKTTDRNVYSHAILDSDLKLQYNMEEGYNIYVEADFGELGKSMSEAVNVKVSGKSKFSGKVFSNDYYTPLANATVTMTLKTDEFGNEVDATKYTYTYNTNSNGDIFETQNQNGEITQVKEFQFHNGIYEVTVEAEYHEPYYTDEFLIEHDGENNNLSVKLTPDQTAIFGVKLFNITFNSVDVYLENNNWEEAQEGYYYVYLKNGEKTEDLGQKYFAAPNDMATSVYFTYSDWANLGKGNYQFGVAKKEGGKINWSAVQSINYDILDGAGEWTEAANWRDGKLPEENAEVCIIANVTIAKGKAVTVKNVNIKSGGSLTINGSLTANEVVNEAGNDALVIKDGGQLRQNNTNLKGKFVMTVTPPTSWDESNIDGWQFIASPVEGVEFSKFVPANDGQGDYDLYQYDGENNKWRNHKQEYGENEVGFEFGDKFVVGTAYLASLQYERDVMFSGILNAAQTHTFNVSHNAEKHAANFHLLGNPFTFAMDVKNLQASGLATGYAVLNTEGNDYVYLTEGQIPVGDGFFVMATESTAALSYSEPARGAAEETANINIVAKGAAGSNNVIINMAGDKEGFRKLEGFNKEIANIYVENKGNKYAIYNCESNANEVELTFVAKQMGSYSLSFDINGEFETVTLVDRMTGVETDMIAEGEYNFIATSNDMKNRFVVRLSNSMTATEEFLANFVYQSGEELIVNAEGTIQIIDMMGRVVYSAEHSNGSNRINVSEFNNAAYVVRVVNGNGVKSQKVVIY